MNRLEIMERKTCNICGKNKKVSKFYKHRGQCKRCYLDKKKQPVDDEIDDDDDIAESLDVKPVPTEVRQLHDEITQLHQENVQVKDTIAKMQENMTHMDNAMSYYQQITAKLENTLQELGEENTKSEKLSQEINARLSVLCDENAKLRSDVDMCHDRMDLMDESILRNVSVSDDMGKDIKKIQTTAIGLSGKMGYHREMVYEMGDAYYQFIMGNVTKYEVRERLVAKGLVVYKKRDDDVD
jgi:chromosome segregation ATPase